jgi:TPR repeat protein
VFRLDRFGNAIRATLGSPTARLARAGQLTGEDAQAAFGLLTKAAKAGVPAALYQVGRAYLSGLGVPSSLATALHWLTRAAEADVVDAQVLLASLALHGACETANTSLFEPTTASVDRQPNHQVALYWAEKAARHEAPEAQAMLGYILTGGPEELRDPERGEQYYRSSAEAGCAQGQLGWALVLLRQNSIASTREARTLLQQAAASNLPTPHFILGAIAESGAAGDTDFVAAAEHYRIAAELNHATAQLRYGIALLTGRGVAVDPFHAESWLRRAALAGEPAAAALVGGLYAGDGALPPNHVEAAVWFRRAAEAGHVGAAKSLGHLLSQGAGIAPDPEEAVRWLRVAIEDGDSEARDDLARLALTGDLPETDRQTTCQWFRQRAEAGDLAAAYNLGLCLAEGIGAPRDDTEAFAWFERAAATVPVARYWCGRMRAEGRGAPADPKAARIWFLRSAELCDPDADVAAGEMLFNGRGGPPHKGVAMALFKRAASAGHPGALYALRVLSGAD